VFAIVDDDNDMGPLTPRLVLTTWARGLQDSHADALIRMLGRADDSRLLAATTGGAARHQ
jgi:hypothetical protein